MLSLSSFRMLAMIRENPSLICLSEKTGLSVQTVRRTLEAVDKEYDCQLFSSFSSESAELSDAGDVYAAAAQKIIRILSDADARAEKIIRERRNAVVVGSVSKSLDKRLKNLDGFRLRNVFFDITDTNAGDSMRNLGKSLDMVIGFYDDALLKRYKLEALTFSDKAMAVAASSSSSVSRKKHLDIEDIYEHRLYVPRKGFSRRIDNFVNDIKDFHPRIEIMNAESYSPELMRKIREDDDFLLASQDMDLSGYSLKCIPVDWNYKISYGLLYSAKCEKAVQVVDSLLSDD